MKIKHMRKTIALLLSATLVSGMCISSLAAENVPGDTAGQTEVSNNTERVTDSTAGQAMEQAQDQSSGTLVITADASDKESIEDALNLANVNPEWTYSEESDSWTIGIVTAVTNAELPDYQGVSVCVPGAYVKGVDTDGDGIPDVAEGTASGNLVIDYDAEVTSTNGQVYTAATAPVIINTGILLDATDRRRTVREYF